ncbi:hypothetical protein FI667_g12191, partial [Globisporangium splendens]
MAQRSAVSSSSEERADFRRLAAQFGISAHALLDDDSVDHDDTDADAAGGDPQASCQSRRQRPTHDDTHVESEDNEVLEEVDNEEDEEITDQYQYDSVETHESLVVASDSNSGLSANESMSSELSLPRSFGHYERRSGAAAALMRQKPFVGMSQFDGHLVYFLTAAAGGMSTATSAAAAGSRGIALARPQDTTGALQGSEMVRKFYEVQVDKIRSQLVLTVQAQRQLEKTLQEERTTWQTRIDNLEVEHAAEKSRWKQEREDVQADLVSMKKRLKMEKTHFTDLQISDALAEQLSRQDEQDLSVKEYIQLTVHRKVTKLETDLEQCRKEIEELQKLCASYKSSASNASEEVAQVRRVADAKQMRLEHELELSEATRKEMERQIAALCTQIGSVKEEQRKNDAFFSNRANLQEEFDRLQTEVKEKETECNLVRSQNGELLKRQEELEQKVVLLAADKSFLQDAKTHLEEHEALLLKKQRDLVKIESLQAKHEDDVSQSVHFQNETRLHFEKKLDDELAKFVELSKQEIERIRASGQVVYERENRLLKEARDDALKQVEMLESKLQYVQSSLEEKANQLKMSLEEQMANCRAGKLEIDMLGQKLEVHKEEFVRLEPTSTTKITQLGAALEIEEYEQLEVDLDSAVLQTGALVDEDKDENSSPSKLNEIMTTFGAIPTSNKRRFQQSVLLAQRVVKYQRESLEFQHQLKAANAERSRLAQEIEQLKVRLANFHQPQSYLIDKLNCKDQELQAAQQKQAQVVQQLHELRKEYALVMDDKVSLQKQIQQVLARREDLDVLKSTVHGLQQKLQCKLPLQQDAAFSTSRSAPGVQHSPATNSANCPTKMNTEMLKKNVHEGMDSAPSPMISSTCFMKVSPPPSIASKMTERPSSGQFSEPSELKPTGQELISASSPPKCKMLGRGYGARNAAVSACMRIPAGAATATPRCARETTRLTPSHGPFPASSGWCKSATMTATTRLLATQSSSTTDASYELLKKDFRKWLRKEAQLLSLLMLVGVTGVYFYKNRENAPSNKVLRLLAEAEQSAKKDDREGALKHCLHAYSITKATNSQDRHSFELAFAIAAQFETLGKVNQATVYYQEALGNIPYVRDAATRDLNRVVTLDRIAQCYQDKGEQVTAEKYYKQAVSVYDASRAGRATEPPPDAQFPVDREIPAVLFNYGQQLMHLKRWDEAAYYLRRALALARGGSASVSEENVAKIESMLQNISSATEDVRDLEDEDIF